MDFLSKDILSQRYLMDHTIRKTMYLLILLPSSEKLVKNVLTTKLPLPVMARQFWKDGGVQKVKLV